jgi:hypothetical protein
MVDTGGTAAIFGEVMGTGTVNRAIELLRSADLVDARRGQRMKVIGVD